MGSLQANEAYHRLVKTTPKPRATKNRSGELVGPELLCWLLLLDAVADEAGPVVVGADMAAAGEGWTRL